MRELAAYSKLINLSARERAKFEAALVDKQIEFPNEVAAATHPDVLKKIRDITAAHAKQMGFVKDG